MSIWRSLATLGRSLFRKREVERELDEELRAYLELSIEEKVARGMDPETARRRARIEFESFEKVKEEVRDVRPGRWLEEAWQDLAFSFRNLARRPAFSALILLTLGLGLAANTAIFGVFHAVLLRPMPYLQPEQLVHVFEVSKDRDFGRREASWGDYLDLSRAGVFAGIAGYNGGSVTLTGVAQPDRVRVLQVTDGFFELLGVEPARGRGFVSGESGAEGQAAPVMLLTHGSWQRRFGGEDGVVGRVLQLNGSPFTVVGVLPAGFEFPLRGDAEFVLPLHLSPEQQQRRYWHWLDVIARLEPGQTREQAAQELESVARRFTEIDPEGHEDAGITLVPLREEMVGSVRPALAVLMGAVGLVLLVVCANVAGLMVARAVSRRREMGIRAALGAGRGRLVRQLLTETVPLALGAGLLGLLAAPLLIDLLTAAIPQTRLQRLPHLQSISLDLPVWLFGLALALACGALLAVTSSWKTLRLASVDVLKEARATHARRGRADQFLVVAEVALAVILLVGAGLLSRSLVQLLEVSPGFDTRGLLTWRIAVPSSRYQGEKLAQFHRELEARLAALPGVRSAAAVSQLPLTGRGDTGSFTVVGGDPGERPEVNLRFVSPEYFSTLGLPLLRGREFAPEDRLGGPGVVLANQLLAERIFGGDALGRRVVFRFFEGRPEWEIVGVVADETVDQPGGGNTPVLYFSMQQLPFNTFSMLARIGTDPGAAERAIRRTVGELDGELPVFEVRTMEEIVSTSSPIFVRRYLMSLVGAFAALTLFLAALGIYGILAYFVRSRRREIAIRMTLGADRGEISRLVVGRGLRLALAGAIAGLAGALAGTELISALLLQVSPTDPVSLAAALLVLGAAALLACGIPALRAARIDPVRSLRCE